MKQILKLITVMIVLMIVSACGSDSKSEAPADTATVGTGKTDTGCPVGTWFNTNGYNDYIAVAANGLITIKDRTGGSATGTVSCVQDSVHITITSGGSSYTLSGSPGRVFWYAQKAGTYNCTYALSGSIFQVYCPDVSADDGNKFNPAQTYYVQQ